LRFLDSINVPSDLKKLKKNELAALAKEIRQEIIDVVSINGGHLASNLGVVELTIALHRTFDSPDDKIIWDVGHQCYVHKLLTGRKEKFKTLRQFGGLAGYPKREESVYDCFNTGHAGTAISAALGFVKARDIKHDSYNVVAVIGDGTMSIGMTYEALNHAGSSDSNLIIVLNDNEMFISPHVGAMSTYLNKIRTNPNYDKRKERTKAFLSKIPVIGTLTTKAIRKFKDGLKYMLVPGRLFEELGLTYLGPIDGHDIAALEKAFKQAKNKKGPILIHAVTCKGKGYDSAIQRPDIFHGIGPFNKGTGEIIEKHSPPSYTSVFGQTICELAKQDENIVAVTAAMENGTGLNQFRELYPERFFDVGIAEQHAVTFAAGLALGGMKPVVSMYSTFYQRAYDQVLHDVCLQNAAVVLAVDRGGIVGEDGPTHHGIFDISFLRAIPNLTIMSPKDENELRNMICSAFIYHQPVVIRYPRADGFGVPIDEKVQIMDKGKAELLCPGSDITLIGFGPIVYICLEAARELRKKGIEAGVINLRFIHPIDQELIISQAKKTGKIVTIEDHILNGGVGSAILEILEEQGLAHIQVERIGYQDYVTHGAIPVLHKEYGIGSAQIISAVMRIIEKNQQERFVSAHN